MSTPSFKLTVGGTDLTADVNVLLLECQYHFNQISEATVQLTADSAAGGNLTESLDAKFKEGEAITFSLGDQDDAGSVQPVFTGIITGIGLRVSAQKTVIEIQCHGEEVRLLHQGMDTLTVQAASGGKAINDADVLKTLCTALSVPIDTIGKSTIEHSQLAHVQDSAWKSASRSLANGFLVLPTQKGIWLDKPENLAGKTHEIDVDGITNAHFHRDVRRQIGKIQMGRFDVKTQKNAALVTGSAKTSEKLTLAPSAAATALKQSDALFYVHSQQDDAALTGHSSAQVLYRNLDYTGALLSLTVIAPSMPVITSHLKNSAIVLMVLPCQRYLPCFDGKGWVTRVWVGVSWHHSGVKAHVTQSKATISGLDWHCPTFKEDPLKLYRFPVKVPALGDKDNIIWARGGTPFATEKAGLFLPPKANDEVVLGFFGGDMSDPVILTSMHNPKNVPPYPIDKETDLRGLLFEPEKAGLTYASKDALFSLALGDKINVNLSNDKGLSMAQDKQTLELTTDIVLTSDGALTFTSGKDATVDASKGKINLKSTKTQVE